MSPNSFLSKSTGIFRNKCPRCHRGNFWEHGNPYINVFFRGARMNENCSKCGLKYEMESGFWYGGMIISYVINVILLILGWLTSEMLFDEIGIWEEAGFISLFMVFFFPITFYLSRLLWINIFVKYDPNKWEDP
jgi:uncharacterized protein (DUF983 family)